MVLIYTNQSVALIQRTIVLITVIFSGLFWSTPSETNDQKLSAQPHFQRKGLDVKNNPIDELINLLGYTCHRNPKFPRACLIQVKLVEYLKSLPNNLNDIFHELSSLGAQCELGGVRLTCLYERRAETIISIMGAKGPEDVMDDLFRIKFVVTKDKDSSLKHDVKFDRESHVRSRSRN